MRESISERLRPVFLILLTAFVASACGKAPDDANQIEQALPSIPGSATFGPLYPRLNELLNGERPDVVAAVRETRAWAEAKLGEFTEGACAQTQVVGDGEFTRIFGRSTLGVTLPWMQIFVRDGNRDPDPFLWKDPSLFVSTVLHEYVHSIQRARQTRGVFATSDCMSSRQMLVMRQGVWAAGFDTLRTKAELGGNYDPRERVLLYHWASPIERARDEVEAALMTVKWMDDHPDELNAYTFGGANNWAYALQFLNQLKALSTSNCFSPEESAFQEEQRIYREEIPRYLTAMQGYEPGMRALLRQQNVPALNIELRELQANAMPTGRMGTACNNAALSQLPRFPSANDLPGTEHDHPHLQ